MIECYPKDEEDVPAVRYVPMAKVVAGNVSIAARCYDAVLYMIANLYYQSVNEVERAKVMAMECAELLGVTVTE